MCLERLSAMVPSTLNMPRVFSIPPDEWRDTGLVEYKKNNFCMFPIRLLIIDKYKAADSEFMDKEKQNLSQDIAIEYARAASLSVP
jgi:hypothetical protein